MSELVLVLNAGSSSLKFAVFDTGASEACPVLARGQVEGIGTAPRMSARDGAGATMPIHTPPSSIRDGRAALAHVADWLRATFGGARVLGVSPDSVASHKKFAEKYGLPFTLLADPEKAVCQAYDVWKEKTLYGRKFMGVVRTTFVIGPDGTIAKVFPRVRVDGHADAVRDALLGTDVRDDDVCLLAVRLQG